MLKQRDFVLNVPTTNYFYFKYIINHVVEIFYCRSKSPVY